MDPYRVVPAEPLPCPRCKQPLPPLDVARCACGTWVSAFAAELVLTDEDRRRDPVKRWWRVLEPCPRCDDKMGLYGSEPGLLQGCELHGFWIDADTIAHTGLGRGVDVEAIERKRADPDEVDAELARVQRLVAQRAEAARPPAAPPPREATEDRLVDERVEHELRLGLGGGAGRELHRRIVKLELANERLAARVAALEAARDRRA